MCYFVKVSNDGKTAASIAPGLATAALLSTAMGARAAKSGKVI